MNNLNRQTTPQQTTVRQTARPENPIPTMTAAETNDQGY